MHHVIDEYLMARARYEEALQRYRDIGDRLGEATCLQGLGDVHRGQAEHPLARARYEEALQRYRDIGNRYRIADVFRSMGHLCAEAEDRQEAVRWIEQAAQLFEQIGVILQADRAREQAKVWCDEEGANSES
jgi:tetratricopeptide (TPR) repeat protein